jgi:hypothetical protein
MSAKKISSLVFVWLLSISALFAQTFPRGAILDDELYDNLPQKAVQPELYSGV